MKHTFPLLVVIALVTAAGFAAVAAQDTGPELDLEQIRARAGEFTEDAEALATSVRNRAETLVDDARTTQGEAQANRAAYVASVGTNASGEVLDFDAMVREQAAAERSVLGTSPRFIAFASLSMPEASLKALVQDMARAGGVTVLRGFPEGNADLFKRRLASIWSDGSETGALGIDPRLFRAFDRLLIAVGIVLEEADGEVACRHGLDLAAFDKAGFGGILLGPFERFGSPPEASARMPGIWRTRSAAELGFVAVIVSASSTLSETEVSSSLPPRATAVTKITLSSAASSAASLSCANAGVEKAERATPIAKA